MSAGSISIQRQGPLASANALDRAVRIALNEAQDQMRRGVLRCQDSALVKAASALAKPALPIVGDIGAGRKTIDQSHAYQSFDIAGIERKCVFKIAIALAPMFSGVSPLFTPRHALKIEVHRVGKRCALRAPRFGFDQLRAQLVGEARDDLVLHVEKIGDGLVEALGPEMVAGLGIDKLDIDAQAIAAALNRAFEDVADVQLATDLLHIDMLALVGEGGVARDYEGTSRCATNRWSGSQ